MGTVTVEDVRRGLRALGLEGERACVHASVRSLGHVARGEATIVQALTTTLRTVLVPAFCSRAAVPPPTGDRPARNGIDYAHLPSTIPAARAFDPATSPVDRDMGAVSRALTSRADTHRSGHPLDSFTAWGDGARALAADHAPDEPFAPLARLSALGGHVLLLGVTLSRCSAIHLAEEAAGRRPFVRWVLGADGAVHRARTGGDSDGFDRLWDGVADLLRETRIGLARVVAVRLDALVERAAARMRADPGITMCDPSCRPCRDACAGGPVEAER